MPFIVIFTAIDELAVSPLSEAKQAMRVPYADWNISSTTLIVTLMSMACRAINTTVLRVLVTVTIKKTARKTPVSLSLSLSAKITFQVCQQLNSKHVAVHEPSFHT